MYTYWFSILGEGKLRKWLGVALLLNKIILFYTNGCSYVNMHCQLNYVIQLCSVIAICIDIFIYREQNTLPQMYKFIEYMLNV